MFSETAHSAKAPVMASCIHIFDSNARPSSVLFHSQLVMDLLWMSTLNHTGNMVTAVPKPIIHSPKPSSLCLQVGAASGAATALVATLLGPPARMLWALIVLLARTAAALSSLAAALLSAPLRALGALGAGAWALVGLVGQMVAAPGMMLGVAWRVLTEWFQVC